MIKKLCISLITALIISTPVFANKAKVPTLTNSDYVKSQPLIKTKPKPPTLTNKTSGAVVGGAGFVCAFDARPQGFKIKVEALQVNGMPKTSIQVQKVQPAIYTSYTDSVGSLGANQSVDYRGKQDMGSGKAINGGWARRSNGGTLILGKVAVIHGYSQGSPYTESDKTVTLDNFPSSHSITCDQSGLNNAIAKLNQYAPQSGTVPLIEGSSMAWNDNSAPGPSVGGGSSNDWAGGLYDAYYDANGQPGMSFNVTEYQFDLNNGLISSPDGGQTYSINNALIQAFNPNKAKQWEQYAQDRELDGSVRAWFKDQQSNDFQLLIASPGAGLQLMDIEDENAILLLPDRFGTPEYLEFKNANNLASGSGIPSSSFKYPAYLLDPPKHPAWYAGNTASGFGPSTQTYSHNPLASTCNPANSDYITPAFLNPVILEELRTDWRYLTETNIKALSAKDLEFHNVYLNRHVLACPATFNGQGLNSIEINERCDNMLAIYNPSIKRPSVNDSSSVLPAGSNSKKNILRKSKTSPSAKITKTAAYYQDLIDNKLFDMNSAYSAQACLPKASAIKKR